MVPAPAVLNARAPMPMFLNRSFEETVGIDSGQVERFERQRRCFAPERVGAAFVRTLTAGRET